MSFIIITNHPKLTSRDQTRWSHSSWQRFLITGRVHYITPINGIVTISLYIWETKPCFSFGHGPCGSPEFWLAQTSQEEDDNKNKEQGKLLRNFPACNDFPAAFCRLLQGMVFTNIYGRSLPEVLYISSHLALHELSISISTEQRISILPMVCPRVGPL